MVQNKTFLICVLQHRNSSYAITACLHLFKALSSAQDLKSQCKIVIAASSRSDNELLKLISIFGDTFDIDIFECNPSYPEKMKAVLNAYPQEQYTYFIKHDEDLFLSEDSWIRLLRNSPQELNDTKNLLTTVNLSTGIPSWNSFVRSFFPLSLQRNITDHLIHDDIPSHVWGNDYSKVNEKIRKMKVWNENLYWEAVNKLSYDYKGIHPVRTNIWYTKTINEYCIEHYDSLFESTSNKSFTRCSNRYFCNSFFLIPYATYKTIFEDTTLYCDAFDEVPINAYKKRRGLSFSFLDDSCGIHILYNSVYNQTATYNKKNYNGADLEEQFSYAYFKKITHILARVDKRIHDLHFIKTPFIKRLKNNIKLTKTYGSLYLYAFNSPSLRKVYRRCFKK